MGSMTKECLECLEVIYGEVKEKSQRMNMCTLGTRGFSRVQWEFSVLAEGRHIFGHRPNSRAAKPPEKPLAQSGAFYRPR